MLPIAHQRLGKHHRAREQTLPPPALGRKQSKNVKRATARNGLIDPKRQAPHAQPAHQRQSLPAMRQPPPPQMHMQRAHQRKQHPSEIRARPNAESRGQTDHERPPPRRRFAITGQSPEQPTQSKERRRHRTVIKHRLIHKRRMHGQRKRRRHAHAPTVQMRHQAPQAVNGQARQQDGERSDDHRAAAEQRKQRQPRVLLHRAHIAHRHQRNALRATA